jgi:hypothetical protein
VAEAAVVQAELAVVAVELVAIVHLLLENQQVEEEQQRLL